MMGKLRTGKRKKERESNIYSEMELGMIAHSHRQITALNYLSHLVFPAVVVVLSFR